MFCCLPLTILPSSSLSLYDDVGGGVDYNDGGDGVGDDGGDDDDDDGDDNDSGFDDVANVMIIVIKKSNRKRTDKMKKFMMEKKIKLSNMLPTNSRKFLELS